MRKLYILTFSVLTLFTYNVLGVNSGDKWTIPFGAGIGKIIKVGGKLPLNLQAGVYYNVVRPELALTGNYAH